jgi:hypothetical protein
LTVYHFDAQSFLLATHDVHCLKLAALDTLQHSLAGDAKCAHCFTHRQKVVARFAREPSHKNIGQANAPWRARRQLLAADDAVVEQAVDGRRSDAKRDGSLPNGQQFAFGFFGCWLEARDTPMAA